MATTMTRQPKSAETNMFLCGVLGPQRKILTERVAVVSGALPAGLVGLYVRNGPNPVGDPRTGRHHWFEGDGMLHGVWLSGHKDSGSTGRGEATIYANRYVETESFKNNRKQVEKDGKKFYYSIFMDFRGITALVRYVFSTLMHKIAFALPLPSFVKEWFRSRWVAKDINNTAVVHHNDRLFALVESGVPVEVCTSTLATIGHETFGGKLKHTFTAHPKVCPVTKECLFFGYMADKPYCSLSSIDCKGVKAPSVEIPLPSPIMMHDFGITQNYAIFFDLPLTFSPDFVVKGKCLFSWKEGTPCRIGIVPRSVITDRTLKSEDSPATFDDHDPAKGLRKAPVKWFSMETPCYIFHVGSAHEELRLNRATGTEETIVVVTAVRHPAGFNLDYLGGLETPTHRHDQPLTGTMTRYECNLTSGLLTEVAASDNLNCEFPVVPSSRVGLPTRFCYVGASELRPIDMANPIHLDRVVKYDIATLRSVGVHKFPEGSFIGEFSFSPRQMNDGNTTADAKDDDGYLLGYLTQQVMQQDPDGSVIRCTQSYFCVLDAEDMSLVAQVALPHTVPLGFHGTFVPGAKHKQ